MVAKFRYIGYMEDPHITIDVVTQQLKRIKENKSVGSDGIKPDLLKILGNDTHFINILTDTAIHQRPYWYPKKGTNNKRYTTNRTNKFNIHIIYGNSKDKT